MRFIRRIVAIIACTSCQMALAADGIQATLAKKLDSTNPDEQFAAVQTLGDMGLRSSSTVPALIKLLAKDDLALRHEVIMALGKINTNADQVVPALSRFLDDKTSLIQQAAIESLRLYGPDAKSALPQIYKVMDGGDEFSKVIAARAIVDIQREQNDRLKKAIDVLVKGLSNSNLGVAQDASNGLANVGAFAVPLVITQLQSSQSRTAIHACDTLAMIGPDAEVAVESLLKLADSENVELRAHVLRTLGAIKAKPDVAVPVLTKQLKADSNVVRISAASALGAYGTAAGSGVAGLVEALKDSDDAVRRTAAESLGNIGVEAKSAIPALVAALDDTKGAVTINAVEALGKIGKPAVPALIEKMKIAHFQQLIISVLSEIGPDAADAVPALQGTLFSKDSEISRESILALAAIGPAAKPAISDLLKILNDEKSAVRPASAYALGRIGAKDAEGTLKKTLDSANDPLLKLASIWALLQLDPENETYAKVAVPHLIRGLTSERPRVRRESATALGKLNKRAASAVEGLRAALNDSDEEVRMEALVALAEIGPESSSAVTEISQILGRDDSQYTTIACYALGKIGPASKPALPLLRRLIQSHDGFERTVAAWALVKIAPDKDAIETAIPLLATALQKAERVNARVVAAETLGEIGSGSPAARAALVAAEKDSSELVQKAAREALSKLK